MIIAHDLGTTGDKASLHHDDGRMVSATTSSYPTHYALGGVAEQDPGHWWDAVVEATRSLLQRTGTAPGEIRAICVTGQMMGGVFLDRHLDPVGPAIIWADSRASRQRDTLAERVGEGEGYRITGHPLNATYSLSKVMWLRDREPDAFAKVHRVALAKDFVNARLTGRLVTDPSDASGMNAYDQSARRWSSELLAAAGLSPELFPEILPSSEILGPLLTEPASDLGLPAGIPVIVGGGDGPVAALGAGVVGPDDGAYACLGTSSWVSFASDEPVLDPRRRTMTFNHVADGRFVPTATMQTGAGALEWIADVLGSTKDLQAFDELLGAAASVEAAGEGLYFLPYLLGERAPHWNPDARAAFVGMSRHHTREHLARAVLEGVAFNLGTCIQAFRESGAVIDRIDAVGGGARSDVWLQILADVWGITVRRRSIVDEANSLGAAVLAAAGIGSIESLHAAGSLSEVTHEFRPREDRHSLYAEGQQIFERAYAALESWFPARVPRI